jgi:hypothetical protein
MEESVGEEEKEVARSTAGVLEIKRTQSSLELLSNAALAAMGSDRQEEQEEASSARSADTSVVSARVTPSLSQSTSQVSMGAGAGAVANATEETEPQPAAGASDRQKRESARVTSKPVARRINATPPQHRNNLQSPVAGSAYADMPGLPIDNYAAIPAAAYPATPPQRMYLPESYLPHPESYINQPPFYLHGGTPGPAPGSVRYGRSHEHEAPPFSGQRGGLSKNPLTHAAFLPPRSTSVRSTGEAVGAPSSSNQPHYRAFVPPSEQHASHHRRQEEGSAKANRPLQQFHRQTHIHFKNKHHNNNWVKSHDRTKRNRWEALVSPEANKLLQLQQFHRQTQIHFKNKHHNNNWVKSHDRTKRDRWEGKTK